MWILITDTRVRPWQNKDLALSSLWCINTGGMAVVLRTEIGRVLVSRVYISIITNCTMHLFVIIQHLTVM